MCTYVGGEGREAAAVLARLPRGLLGVCLQRLLPVRPHRPRQAVAAPGPGLRRLAHLLRRRLPRRGQVCGLARVLHRPRPDHRCNLHGDRQLPRPVPAAEAECAQDEELPACARVILPPLRPRHADSGHAHSVGIGGERYSWQPALLSHCCQERDSCLVLVLGASLLVLVCSRSLGCPGAPLTLRAWAGLTMWRFLPSAVVLA
mmetsp:Transcript_78731/g.230984  ORF Transcript_78731/g.230984 Transcript_78731/m.230984 type:complete len:203 (+) Transcript_78731:944-1552(+)